LLVQKTTLYEVITRWTDDGVATCQKVEVTQVVDDVTHVAASPPATTVVEITREEAVALISAATMKGPDPDGDAE